MKRLFIVATVCFACLTVMAEGIIIHKKDGSTLEIPSTEIDFIQVYNDNSEEVNKCETFNASNFSLNGYPVKKFDESNGIITIEIPYEVDRTSLVANFDIAPTSTVMVDNIEQENGISANDFSVPVKYTVTSLSGESNEYYVALCFSDMPVVYLMTPDSQPITSKEEYITDATVFVINSANDAIYNSVSTKGRGNSSWAMPKKSYTIKLNKKDTFLGLPKHKTFAMIANYADKTLLRNVESYKAGREILDNIAWSPNTCNAHFIVNGEYYGLYASTESVKIDKNRVNIPNLEDCKSINDIDNYGFIIEANWRKDENFWFSTTHNCIFTLKEPDSEDIPEEYHQHIINKTQAAEDALYNLTDEGDEELGLYFDLDSFVDWYLINELSRNPDSRYGISCFLYFDPSDGKFHAGPIWDFDIAYGGKQSYTDTQSFWTSTARWPQYFMMHPVFIEKTKNRWNEIKDNLREFFSDGFRNDATQLDFDANINFKRWKILGKNSWQCPDGFEERTTYQSEVEYLINWVNERIEWLDSAINEL